MLLAERVFFDREVVSSPNLAGEFIHPAAWVRFLCENLAASDVYGLDVPLFLTKCRDRLSLTPVSVATLAASIRLLQGAVCHEPFKVSALDVAWDRHRDSMPYEAYLSGCAVGASLEEQGPVHEWVNLWVSKSTGLSLTGFRKARMPYHPCDGSDTDAPELFSSKVVQWAAMGASTDTLEDGVLSKLPLYLSDPRIAVFFVLSFSGGRVGLEEYHAKHPIVFSGHLSRLGFSNRLVAIISALLECFHGKPTPSVDQAIKHATHHGASPVYGSLSAFPKSPVPVLGELYQHLLGPRGGASPYKFPENPTSSKKPHGSKGLLPWDSAVSPKASSGFLIFTRDEVFDMLVVLGSGDFEGWSPTFRLPKSGVGSPHVVVEAGHTMGNNYVCVDVLLKEPPFCVLPAACTLLLFSRDVVRMAKAVGIGGDFEGLVETLHGVEAKDGILSYAALLVEYNPQFDDNHVQYHAYPRGFPGHSMLLGAPHQPPVD